jgi:NAD+ kinase
VTVAVMTHRRMDGGSEALRELIGAARRAGATLSFDEEETRKLKLEPADGIEVDAPHHGGADLCVVLGGDGTILTALREYAGTGVPVLQLPTIDVGRPQNVWTAINDISVHRKPGMRVADLAYGLAGEEIGRVRCDGLVVATPQGSTGYNLANGGPVLAWGVRGFVVSFIAPHSLTARALVVAPDDLLTINNASREEPVEVHVDGRPACELPAGEDIHVEFANSYATLAQLPGASFYHRLRERFGRLAK